MERHLLIVIAVPLHRPGGLLNYLLALTQGLAGEGCSGEILHTHPELLAEGLLPEAWSALRVAPKPGSGSARWPSFASRAWTHPIAVPWFASAWNFPAFVPCPQAVHFIGTGWDFVGFAAERLARKLGVPFTVWPAVHAGTWGDAPIDLNLYRRADTVFVQSEFEASHLEKLGLPKGKACICHPAVPVPSSPSSADLEAFRIRHDLAEKQPVLFLGRRDAGKGYQVLLKAWPLVTAKFPNARLLLAGPQEDLLAEGLPEGCVDLGTPDEHEKQVALAACALLCLPSATESFGIVYTEAWWHAKPVICGTAEPSRELVKKSGGGLVSDGSLESIASAVMELLGNPALAEEMGRAGALFVREELTLDKMTAVHKESFGFRPKAF